MNRFTIPAVLVLAGLLAGSARAQDKIAWKFKEGDKFYLQENTTTKQTIKVLGNAEEKEEVQYNLVSFHIKEKTDDKVVIVQTMEELSTKTERGKQDPLTEKMLEKLKGHQFTITIDKNGKMTKFEGYESLIKKISNDDPMVEKTLRAILTADTFKKTAENTFTMLPDKAVKKGDTWNRETQMSMGPIGSFKINAKYTYDGMEKDLAVIQGTSTLTYSAPKDDGGLPFKISKGNIDATNAKTRLLFDSNLGRPSSEHTTLALKGNLTLAIGEMEVEMTLEMEQRTDSKVSTTRPEKK
jgi:hypothetical protein